MSAAARFARSPEGVTGALLLVLVVVAAGAGRLLFPGDPMALAGPPLLPPFTDAGFLLGTDRLGRDVLAMLVHGAAVSLGVGLTATAAALLLGAAVGTAAGFAGGWTDEALMRLTEAFQTVPGFILALALVSVLGPALSSIVAAIAISSWTGPARIVRAEILTLRRRDFVDACRVLGMAPVEIALCQVLPNALAPLVALAAVIVAAAILVQAALAFLGLGDPNLVSWGGMIADGRAVLRTAPWLSAIPGLAIVVTVLAVNLLGDGLGEALAPRRARP